MISNRPMKQPHASNEVPLPAAPQPPVAGSSKRESQPRLISSYRSRMGGNSATDPFSTPSAEVQDTASVPVANADHAQPQYKKGIQVTAKHSAERPYEKKKLKVPTEALNAMAEATPPDVMRSTVPDANSEYIETDISMKTKKVNNSFSSSYGAKYSETKRLDSESRSYNFKDGINQQALLKNNSSNSRLSGSRNQKQSRLQINNSNRSMINASLAHSQYEVNDGYENAQRTKANVTDRAFLHPFRERNQREAHEGTPTRYDNERLGKNSNSYRKGWKYTNINRRGFAAPSGIIPVGEKTHRQPDVKVGTAEDPAVGSTKTQSTLTAETRFSMKTPCTGNQSELNGKRAWPHFAGSSLEDKKTTGIASQVLIDGSLDEQEVPVDSKSHITSHSNASRDNSILSAPASATPLQMERVEGKPLAATYVVPAVLLSESTAFSNFDTHPVALRHAEHAKSPNASQPVHIPILGEGTFDSSRSTLNNQRSKAPMISESAAKYDPSRTLHNTTNASPNPEHHIRAVTVPNIRVVNTNLHDVAYCFVEKYYSCLNKGGKALSELYHTDASFLWVFTDEAEEGTATANNGVPSMAKRAYGKEAIQQRLCSLPLYGSETNVKCFNVLPVSSTILLIVVKGKIWFNEAIGRHFCHSFVLQAEALDWYFIRSDMLYVLDAEYITNNTARIAVPPKVASDDIPSAPFPEETHFPNSGSSKCLSKGREDAASLDDAVNSAPNKRVMNREYNSVGSQTELPPAANIQAVGGMPRYQADPKAEGARILQLIQSSRPGGEGGSTTVMGKEIEHFMEAEPIVQFVEDPVHPGVTDGIKSSEPRRKVTASKWEIKESSKTSVDSQGDIAPYHKPSEVMEGRSLKSFENTNRVDTHHPPHASNSRKQNDADRRPTTGEPAVYVKTEQKENPSNTVFARYLPNHLSDAKMIAALNEHMLRVDPKCNGEVISIHRAKHPKKQYGFIVLDCEDSANLLLESVVTIQGINLQLYKSIVKPRVRAAYDKSYAGKR